MIALFLSSFALGIAFCAPPGAITAEALRRGLARGFRPALVIELGSLIGDATWALIALVGAAFLVQNRPARLLMGMMGTLFLLRLAWHALRDANQGAIPAPKPATAYGDFTTGAVLSLAIHLPSPSGLGWGVRPSGPSCRTPRWCTSSHSSRLLCWGLCCGVFSWSD
jgi:chemosensory pili system protein ChpE